MHKTHSHPIPVPMTGSVRRSTVSPLDAELVEFESWLESELDSLGTDGTLYARCVLSILKQTQQNDLGSNDRLLKSPDVLDRVTVAKSLGRDAVLIFPMGTSPRDVESASEIGSDDARRRPLLECLTTVDLDEFRLRFLTDEILRRYGQVARCYEAALGNTSNDSIDSGVCPSPVECYYKASANTLNYDEAFPPLSDVENDEDSFPPKRKKSSPVTICDSTATLIPPKLPRSLRSSVGNKLTAPFTREWSAKSAELFNSCRIRHRSWNHTELQQNSYPLPSKLTSHQHQHQPSFVVVKAPESSVGESKLIGCTSRLNYGGFNCVPGRNSSSSLLTDTSNCEECQPPISSSLGTGGDHLPRFILHIIDENKGEGSHKRKLNSSLGHNPNDLNSDSPIAPKQAHYHHPRPPVYFDPNPLLPASFPGFGFDPWGSASKNETADFCVPRMEDMNSSCQLALPETINMTFNDSVLQSDAGVKIPVSSETHFVPIRSESMEDAYLPRSLDKNEADLAYSVGFYGAEPYFILRSDVVEPIVPAISNSFESNGRSLPIKFKAERPEKQCQTGQGASPEWKLSKLSGSGSLKGIGQSFLLADGDNSVALPDPWANRVWVPRLSAEEEEEKWPNGPGFRVVQPKKHELTSPAVINQQEHVENDDDDDDEVLLRYVGNINLLSPLNELNVSSAASSE